MAKRRKQRREPVPVAPPELTGTALLLSEMPVATLDLHGLTADQAERRVRDFLVTHGRISQGRVVHIITGKGTRSEGAAVLPGVVNRLLSGELEHRVDEVAGSLGGGGVVVRVR